MGCSPPALSLSLSGACGHSWAVIHGKAWENTPKPGENPGFGRLYQPGRENVNIF